MPVVRCPTVGGDRMTPSQAERSSPKKKTTSDILAPIERLSARCPHDPETGKITGISRQDSAKLLAWDQMAAVVRSVVEAIDRAPRIYDTPQLTIVGLTIDPLIETFSALRSVVEEVARGR